MLSVPPGRVQYWVDEDLLFTKGGRITESSLTKFLSEHPHRIPFETLSFEMRNWLTEMGYPEAKTGSAAAATSAGRGNHPTDLILVGGVEPAGES